jgi:hypothetical protein
MFVMSLFSSDKQCDVYLCGKLKWLGVVDDVDDSGDGGDGQKKKRR